MYSLRIKELVLNESGPKKRKLIIANYNLIEQKKWPKDGSLSSF